MTPRFDLLDERLDRLQPDMFGAQFLAAEAKDDLHFHIFAQEIDRVVQFEGEVVRIDVWPELNLLNLDRTGSLLLFLAKFLLFVGILAVVGDPADRRVCVGRDFDQVETLLLG